jgi:hypothetical protein
VLRCHPGNANAHVAALRYYAGLKGSRRIRSAGGKRILGGLKPLWLSQCLGPWVYRSIFSFIHLLLFYLLSLPPSFVPFHGLLLARASWSSLQLFAAEFGRAITHG